MLLKLGAGNFWFYSLVLYRDWEDYLTDHVAFCCIGICLTLETTHKSVANVLLLEEDSALHIVLLW